MTSFIPNLPIIQSEVAKRVRDGGTLVMLIRWSRARPRGDLVALVTLVARGMLVALATSVNSVNRVAGVNGATGVNVVNNVMA